MPEEIAVRRSQLLIPVVLYALFGASIAWSQVDVITSAATDANLVTQTCSWKEIQLTLSERGTTDFPGESNSGTNNYYSYTIILSLGSNVFEFNPASQPNITFTKNGNLSLNGQANVFATEIRIPVKCNGQNSPVKDIVMITGIQTRVAQCPSPGGMSVLSIALGPPATPNPQNPSNLSVTFVPANLQISTNGPLPVELTAFTARLRNDAVSLKWSTATETNNYGFVVERSFDREKWESIGFVAGSGTTSSTRIYGFEAKLTQSDRQQELVSFRLRQIDRDGSIEFSPVVSVSPAVVAGTIELKQNFPNPFNPATNISFNLPASDIVSLSVYNELGVEVARIHDGAQLERGWHSASFNATELPSGLYMYRLQTSGVRRAGP
jgi:hypothetical protein